MLTIRDEQLRLMSTPIVAAFEELMCEHIRSSKPGFHAVKGQAGTRALVAAGIVKGRAHGLAMDSDIATLINLMADYGADFERSPDRKAATDLLANPSLPGKLKMHLVHEQLTVRTGGRAIVYSTEVPPDHET
jgi:hypothetical protein